MDLPTIISLAALIFSIGGGILGSWIRGRYNDGKMETEVLHLKGRVKKAEDKLDSLAAVPSLLQQVIDNLKTLTEHVDALRFNGRK